MRTERWTIYVCPDCGWEETDHLWDATDLEEKGPPACPQSGTHGQCDMEPVEVVPASALQEAERERDELREALKAYADEGNWHWNGIFKPLHPDRPDAERGERARRALADT